MMTNQSLSAPTLPADFNKKFRPRSDYHLVKWATPATHTESGIHLPESAQQNFVECQILKSGPGFPFVSPLFVTSARAYMWGQPGNTIVIEKHSFIPLTGTKEGLVHDDDIVGLVRGDEIFPFNDWVKLSIPERPEKVGSIYLPELDQQKVNQAVVTAIGPGKLRKSGKYCGTRLSIQGILSLEAPLFLIGKTVFWSDDATLLEMGRESVSCCFIQASEICGVIEA